MRLPTTSDLLSAGHTDPDRAETALSSLYSLAGLPEPEFIWVASPKAGFRRVQEEFERIGTAELERRAVEALGSGEAAGVCFCEWCRAISVGERIHPAPHTGPSRSEAVIRAEETVMTAIERDLGRSLDDAPRGNFGGTSAHRLMARPYCNPWVTAAADPESDNGDDPDRVAEWMELASAAGWWWPYRGFTVLSARPVRLEMSDGELHREDGPAVVYPDGWSVNAVRNVLLPSNVFEPGALSVQDVLAERNLEVRRVLIDRHGPERFMQEAGGVMVDEDETGQLWCLWTKDPSRPGWKQTMALVRVVDSTPQPDGTRRVYWLHVPPRVRSAREAVAWTFGLHPDDYRPEVQT